MTITKYQVSALYDDREGFVPIARDLTYEQALAAIARLRALWEKLGRPQVPLEAWPY